MNRLEEYSKKIRELMDMDLHQHEDFKPKIKKYRTPCENCGSDRTSYQWEKISPKGKKLTQQYICRDCGHEFQIYGYKKS